MNTLYKNCLRFTTVAACMLQWSCAHTPYAATNKQYKQQAKTYAQTIREVPPPTGFDSLKEAPDFTGTINFNMRKPNFVIIHHTAQNSCEQTLKTFTTVKTQVSAHYVICKDGTVHHMLNDYLRAWQAGISRWGNVTDINSVSIGIEIDNNGFEEFTADQITSLLHLLKGLKKTYGIPAANFIGHADIAPTRKNDPNVHFPWKLLADNGYGLWYGDTTQVTVPESFSNLQALRIIGYDIRDSSAAIQAFKRHFLQQDTSKVLYEEDRKVLFLLEHKYE
ncbi:N-acetylmuramoyl-L-alanine amidase [Deminuibacter soli]|uniref:N-acetylmuramoyl-L-alanine amidase n=1 Tax=Deminuibacter soli TaxID=2291815 RepID=A0A3E1NPI6_9BACT|nr:N-acetylmuramoyl-L-alanine amidase [Deminuibacter soli]RFM29846.1 N-acetylmuramoyl-L-alanine amidase [Deminuibacter soli]